jgi:C-terminal processing protease CtpA/Prc
VLQDLGRAYIIGETTGGNVEILYTHDFSDGSRALIAQDTFRPLNNPNQNWEESGIIPDLTVPSRWDLVTTLTDPAIQAALQHFDGR